MKTYLIISLLILSVLYSQNEYNIDHIMERDGIYYKKFSDKKVNGSVYQMIGDMKVDLGKMKDGKKNGPWTTWYEDGIKESEKTYITGLIRSLVLRWDEKGELRCQGNFIADSVRNTSMKNGLITEWFDNGQQKSRQHGNRNAFFQHASSV